MSCCTPPSAEAITPCEMPADAASADMPETKVLKSPPQRAAGGGGGGGGGAWEGVVRVRAARRIEMRKNMKNSLGSAISCCDHFCVVNATELRRFVQNGRRRERYNAT